MQIFAEGKQPFSVLFFHGILCDTPEKNTPKKIKVYPSIQFHVFYLICTTLYTGYLDLLQNHLFLECQLLHLTTLQVSFSRVL